MPRGAPGWECLTLLSAVKNRPGPPHTPNNLKPAGSGLSAWQAWYFAWQASILRGRRGIV